MVKSSKTHLEEDEEANVYDGLPRRNTTSSAYKGEEMKVEAKSSEQKTNEHRSKHSETEQRRRSKINERFQILRGLIPQNDQKRDKASFLLEVIEYIQFLRDKLNMYEGSYQEPTKLMPWRNQNGLAESYMEHSQVLKNGSSHENNVVTPVMLTNAQNSMESDMGTDAVYKATDLTPGSASPMVPLNNVHAQPNMYALVGRGSMPTQSLQESISDAENMGYQHQSQFWRGRACATDCAILNSSLNEQDLSIESGSSSISSAFSQGVLNTLTQALQSSGVDLSQANISVQIDVGKQVISGQTAMAVSSKDHDKQYQDNLVMTQTGVQSFDENSDRVHKRLRTE